ncbi:MAG: hypothetical protein MI919_11600 [Holophagales bacterium]|nr:hypothetical protein [Holophagales bacterium]
MFAIRALPPEDRGPSRERLGEIVVGDFAERFVVARFPGCARVEDIPAHWHSRLVAFTRGREGIALQTQPSRAWIRYHDGDAVVVQDHALVPEWQGRLGDDGRLLAVPSYASRTEGGEPVSEWRATLRQAQDFLEIENPVR